MIAMVILNPAQLFIRLSLWTASAIVRGARMDENSAPKQFAPRVAEEISSNCRARQTTKISDTAAANICSFARTRHG